MQRSAAVLEKNYLKTSNYKIVGKYINLTTISFMIMGFLLSRSILVESIAPLGIAFFVCMVKWDRYKVPVFASTIFGTILSANSTLFIAKYCVCLTLFMLLSSRLKKIESTPLLALVGAGMVLPISVGQGLFSGNTTFQILMAFTESIVLFISIYTFSYGVDLITNIKNRLSVRPEEAISISLLSTFTIMGLGEVAIFGISMRIVLSTIVVLMTAIIGGATMGASCGVVVGIAFMINNLTSAVYMGIYSFAGLISGAFNKINRFLCILGYILSWMIIYTYSTGISSNLTQLRDILIACLVVILIPDKVFTKVEKLIKSNVASNDVVNDYIMRSKDLTKNRLNNIYKTYSDLANTFDRIREKDRVLDQRDIASVIDMIHNDECRVCSMKRMCWETRFNHTYTMIYNILEEIEDIGELSIKEIPENFRKECMKPESIVKMANYYYRLFVLDYEWSTKFSENRRLIANQIRSISKSIESLSLDLENNIMLDLEKEKSIYDNLQRYGVDVEKVNYITKSNNEFEIEVEKVTCANGRMCEEKIKSALTDIVGEELSARKVGCNSIGDKCKATFVKAQKFKAMTEVSAMSRDGHILCGDNYTFMEINDGKYMMAISDGMGKGKKAYEESSATIDILEKMIDAKIEDEIVIDTINNMLMLKSSDEMFSTLDLGIVDLRRGSLDTIKMGACSTYIKRSNGDIDLISSSSLPVGILSDVKLDRKNAKVNDGDFVIMVSDGIVDSGINKDLGDNWMIYFLDSIKSTNTKKISNMILDRALELQPNQIEDDMTVLVTKICLK
ncbi:stage II sporulation protein E [Metaclostridioides mangenotii]|uniref:Stage II sporulation protein E n=1 Tax=Metaclostridioides mangenotii TaxID=1540 RepID=A0ABS4EEG8_9FIRM|nr:stage II sporulation protein E [Clostridioides mangenotii]MBP1856343.1 stage II sporulation protein E [Clostridioides mangenotii]